MFFYSHFFASYIPGIMMIVWIFIKESPKYFFTNFARSGIWLFLLVYVCYAASVLYSQNAASSVRLLETKLLLPILPLLVVKKWKPSQKLVHLTMMALLIVFVAMLIVLWIKMYRVYAAGHTDHWRLQHTWYLNRSFGLHHGDYAIIALLLVVYFVTERLGKKTRVFHWFPLLLFVAMIYISGSEISRIAIVFSLAIVILNLFWPGFRKAFPWIFTGVSVFSILMIFVFFDGGPKDKLKDNRFIIWPISVELIKEKPLFGYGIGDVQEELNAKYETDGFNEGLRYSYNSHNQFLDLALASGLVGLASLLALFISLAFRASRDENLAGILFVVIMFLFMSVETVLSRLDGVIIFAFFFVLLFSVGEKKKSAPLRQNIH